MSALLNVPALANRLSERWCREICSRSADGFVVSGAGVWPLLAALASGADGVALEELTRASGVGLANGQAAAALALLEEIGEVSASIGLWIREDLMSVDRRWVSRMPIGAVGQLTGDSVKDQIALDTWADQGTDGLIKKFPLTVDESTLLVLATALAVQTPWRRPFSEFRLSPESGPWAGTEFTGLRQTLPGLGAVSVIELEDGRVGRVVVAGDGEVDIHLVLGDVGVQPSSLLTAAFAASSGDAPCRPIFDWGTGEALPGIVVREISATSPGDRTQLNTVAFAVGSQHNLREYADVLGLTEAFNDQTGHFPGIASSPPLCVQQGAQSATAVFSAVGFEAGSVTAMGMAAGSARMPESYTVREVVVTIDRPFGFLAVHRSSGLVLFAGYVKDPAGWPG